MAKFSFSNELWKTKDAQWLAKRNAQWLSVERILANSCDKTQLSSIKKYFMKGEWTPDSKYEPRGGMKFLYSPEHTVEIYNKMMAHCDTKIRIDVFRSDALRIISGEIFGFLTTINEAELRELIKNMLFGRELYSVENVDINGVNVPVFPIELLTANNGFFWYYLRDIEELISNKYSKNTIGLKSQLNLWFSSIDNLDKNVITGDFQKESLLKIFTQIVHYIPNHPNNPAAQAKLEFVNLFKQFAEQGFSHELIENTWQAAKENKEDEWVNRIYECTPEKDSYAWKSWDGGGYTPLICRSSDDINNLHLTIADLYQANGFSQSSYIPVNDKKIDITKLLTKEFLAELPIANRKKVQGELVRITLSDKFMGTNKVHFRLDIIKIIDLPEQTENEIPRLLIIERPDNHYISCLARRYCANREYIVDEIKEETGLQLVRYFGFSHEPTGDREVPPRPQDYKDYQKEMQLPFYDAAYLPLKIGTTAFILNDVG